VKNSARVQQGGQVHKWSIHLKLQLPPQSAAALVPVGHWYLPSTHLAAIATRDVFSPHSTTHPVMRLVPTVEAPAVSPARPAAASPTVVSPESRRSQKAKNAGRYHFAQQAQQAQQKWARCCAPTGWFAPLNQRRFSGWLRRGHGSAQSCPFTPAKKSPSDTRSLDAVGVNVLGVDRLTADHQCSRSSPTPPPLRGASANCLAARWNHFAREAREKCSRASGTRRAARCAAGLRSPPLERASERDD